MAVREKVIRMELPFWFRLLKTWRVQEHGTGLTLAYIAGATARAGNTEATPADVRPLLDEIRAFEHPEELLIVRYCPWIKAPVIGAYPFKGGPIEIDDQLLGGGVTAEDFWEEQAQIAEARVQAGEFSRTGGMQPTWGPFQEKDLKFIESVDRRGRR